jgi:hypothetical protein
MNAVTKEQQAQEQEQERYKNDLNNLVKDIEKNAQKKAEAEAGPKFIGVNKKELKENLNRIISLFNDLESRGVLSYRIEAYTEGIASVLRFAIKGTQPIVIRITDEAVSFENLKPVGNIPMISKHKDLTKNNMIELIKNI